MEVENTKKQSSPSRHSAGVPSAMDVNPADRHDLLSATVAVEVMFTENNTPLPIAVIFFFLKREANSIVNKQ